MTRMARPDCAVMCNLINTHTHTISLILPWEDQSEWHRMTRMTGPDWAVMCNLINTHTKNKTKNVYQIKTNTITQTQQQHLERAHFVPDGVEAIVLDDLGALRLLAVRGDTVHRHHHVGVDDLTLLGTPRLGELPSAHNLRKAQKIT